jgi:uncharacterized membrane protein
MSKTIESSIEVNAPVRDVYNQWTQFEDFPKFMEGVERVEQIDDTTLHWAAEIAGAKREWDAKITEQKPDDRIAWTSLDGTTNAGVVTFHRLSDAQSKVMLQLEVEPEGFVENAGAALGIIERRAEGDLRRFKEFIEQNPPTGEWRGTVEGGQSSPS